jgi:hypothetical protein
MSDDQKARLEAEVSAEQKNIDKIIGRTKENLPENLLIHPNCQSGKSIYIRKE